MQKALPFLGISGALVVATLIGIVGHTNSVLVADTIPLHTLCLLLIFAVQWLFFVPAYLQRNEKTFDLIGSCTYIGVTVIALVLSSTSDPRDWLIGVLVIVWALRLGTFLNSRVRQANQDRRFRSIKHNFGLFLMTWTIQGLWVTLTYAAGMIVITQDQVVPLGALAAIGVVTWLIGFGIEVIADQQKRRFRAVSENQGRFITSGLWAWSQHPNYFGEILLWIGIALIAWPVLYQWEFATLASPVFVWLLLTKISGTRMLDNLAKRDWGQDEEYQAYVARTPKLIPWPPKQAG